MKFHFQISNLQQSLNEEKSLAENLRIEFENQAEELEVCIFYLFY